MNVRNFITPCLCLSMLACGDVDLSHYVTELSSAESIAKFPGYVELMKPTDARKQSFIQREVASYVEHFKPALTQWDPLIIVNPRNEDVRTRMMALAYKKNVVEIHLDKIYQDTLSPGTLGDILRQYHQKNSETIFYIRHEALRKFDWTVLNSYNVIVEVGAKHRPAGKTIENLAFVPLKERMNYAAKLAEKKKYDPANAEMAAFLLFAFMPHESFFTVIDSIIDGNKADVSVYAHYQTVEGTDHSIQVRMQEYADDAHNHDEGRIDELNKFIHRDSTIFTEPSKGTGQVFERLDTMARRVKTLEQGNLNSKLLLDTICKFLVGLFPSVK